jgi:hypothetical protein
MDRFSFIALDLSLQAVIEDHALYHRFREGGETILFKANDFLDPPSSEVFALLSARPHLREHVRSFRAICDGAIAAVPTLTDFLAGRNVPSVVSRGTTAAPRPTPRVIGYVGAFPVVDAQDYATALQMVGNRVELVGKIFEVKEAFGKRGRGRGRPYVFINFGPWQGNILKISIWSEGLTQLQEKPSAAWVGRWIGVTGLLEPPYISARYHYSHLSITVQNDGEIHHLDEREARFRLQSISRAASVQVPAPVATKTRNQEIVDNFRQPAVIIPPAPTPRMPRAPQQRAGRTSPAPIPPSPPTSKMPRPTQATGIPAWVWWVLSLVALLFFLKAMQ